MNESFPFEVRSTPESRMYENAFETYPEFLAALDSALDLSDIIDAVEQNTFVDGGALNERIFFQVGPSDGESVEVTPFLTEEFTSLLHGFIDKTPSAEEIDMKIEHTALNSAVKRVLGIS